VDALVGSYVSCQVARVSKGCCANVTLEWLLPSVGVNVELEVLLVSKAFGAQVASEWLEVIGCVLDQNMSVHLFRIHVLPTRWARLSLVMCSLVRVQLPLGLAHLVANVTGHLTIPVELEDVLLHVGLEGRLATLWAKHPFTQLVAVDLMNVLPAQGVVVKVLGTVLAPADKLASVDFLDMVLVLRPSIKGEVGTLGAPVVMEPASALDVLRVLT